MSVERMHPTESCGQCLFFNHHPKMNPGDGLCMRYPPSFVTVPNPLTLAVECRWSLPTTHGMFWCGEYKPVIVDIGPGEPQRII